MGSGTVGAPTRGGREPDHSGFLQERPRENARPAGVFLRRRTRAERGPDRFTRVEDCDGVWRRRDEPPGRGRHGRSDVGLARDQGDGLSDVQAIRADVHPTASEGLSASESGRQEEVGRR